MMTSRTNRMVAFPYLRTHAHSEETIVVGGFLSASAALQAVQSKVPLLLLPTYNTLTLHAAANLQVKRYTTLSCTSSNMSGSHTPCSRKLIQTRPPDRPLLLHMLHCIAQLASHMVRLRARTHAHPYVGCMDGAWCMDMLQTFAAAQNG